MDDVEESCRRSKISRRGTRPLIALLGQQDSRPYKQHHVGNSLLSSTSEKRGTGRPKTCLKFGGLKIWIALQNRQVLSHHCMANSQKSRHLRESILGDCSNVQKSLEFFYTGYSLRMEGTEVLCSHCRLQCTSSTPLDLSGAQSLSRSNVAAKLGRKAHRLTKRESTFYTPNRCSSWPEPIVK